MPPKLAHDAPRHDRWPMLVRRALRSLLIAVAMATPALALSSSDAAVVTYAGNACHRTVDVIQWTPAAGPLARFVADTFANNDETGLWIGLGRTKTAFWSVEGGDDD